MRLKKSFDISYFFFLTKNTMLLSFGGSHMHHLLLLPIIQKVDTTKNLRF